MTAYKKKNMDGSKVGATPNANAIKNASEEDVEEDDAEENDD